MFKLPRPASVAIPILIFLATLFCYLSALTQVHTFDALSYVLDVDRKPWQELFHPHHLAYGPLGALVRQMAPALGQGGSALVPLQITNALAGALGVALFFVMVRRVTQRFDLALCGSLLLGASYAYWYYAVEVEVYTIATLFLVLCLWLIVALLRQPTARTCAALGLVQAIAVLFHQTNILLCIPVGVAFLGIARSRCRPTEERTGHTRMVGLLSCSLAYGLPLGIIAVGSYLWVGFGISGFHSWEQFMRWTTAYAHTGWWGRDVNGEKWADLGKGLTETLAQPGGAFLGLLLAGLVVLYLRRLVWTHGHLTVVLITWLVTYGAFFFWWEPDNIEFWIASLPPAIFLLVLALDTSGTRWSPGVWLTLAVGVTMLGVNYDSIIRRGLASYDLQRRVASALAQQSQPGDLLLVSDGMQELYLPYYEGRNNVFSLNQALFISAGNWPIACVQAYERIDTALRAGSAVFIDDTVLYPRERSTESIVLERFQLTPEQVTQCFARYIPDLAQLEIAAGLALYHRLPSAQELAQGPGWNFAHTNWGWQASNINNERFGAAWDIVPGVDPGLTSPPLQIDTSRYAAIEVRMAATTDRRDAQLFFLDRDGQLDEARSIRWTLDPGSEMQTYRLDLHGHPGWSGIVTGLRLDPVGIGDGGWVRIESIRLVS